jgi:Thrombospondin type 3 repeat
MKRDLLVLLLGGLLALGACSFSGAEGQTGPGDGSDAGPGDGSQGNDPEDMDGDGVKNAVDNCPAAANANQANGDTDALGDACDSCPLVTNPKKDTLGLGLVQRDHDGDGRGDECDLCPHIKDEPNIDADLDGIGAACDPSETIKNPPPIFLGFYDAPVTNEWQVVTGALNDWELTQLDGRLWWKQKNTLPERRQITLNLPNFREAYVDSVFRIHSISPAVGASTLRSAAPVFGFDNNIYFNCGLRHDVGTLANDAIAAIYNSDTPVDVTTQAWSGAVLDRDVRVVGESVARAGGGPGGDSTLLCNAKAAPATNITVTPNNSTVAPDGKIGLRTFGMVASFDYLFIVNKAAAPAVTR